MFVRNGVSFSLIDFRLSIAIANILLKRCACAAAAAAAVVIGKIETLFELFFCKLNVF